MTLRTCFLSILVCWSTATLQAQYCIPTVTVYNGFSVNIRPIDTNGDQITDIEGAAALRRSDVILNANNPCSNEALQFGMRKSGTGTGMPTDTMVWFNCTDLGTQLVEIWVRNTSGGTNFSETYVIVQDNKAVCGPPPTSLSTACQQDQIPPEVLSFNGFSGTIMRVGNGMPMLVVPLSAFVRSTRDECGGDFIYGIRKSGTGSGPTTDQTVSFDCDELGTQLVEIWAGDQSGNWDYSYTYVIVQDHLGLCGTPPLPLPTACSPDEMPPSILTINGLVQSITWQGPGPVAKLRVEDFIKTAKDKCGKQMTYRISKTVQNSQPPPSGSNTVYFDCNELGTQLVDIWLFDASGNMSKSETYVIVQDYVGFCGRSTELAHVVIPEFKKEILRKMGVSLPDETRRRPAAVTVPLAVWPNPVTDGFTLNTHLNQAGSVRVELYDSYGRLVRVLADQIGADAGLFQQYFPLDTGLQPGIYRCVLHTALEHRVAAVYVVGR